MFLGYLRAVVRRVFTSRPIVLLIIALAALFCLPLAGPSFEFERGIEQSYVEMFRDMVFDDPAESLYHIANDGSEYHQRLWEEDLARNELYKQMIEAYDAGDMPRYFALRAEEAGLSATSQGDIRQSQELDAAWYGALADVGAQEAYYYVGSMPASLYLVAHGHGFFAPLSPLLPFLNRDMGHGDFAYDYGFDFLLWLVPIGAVAMAAASLQARGRLGTQYPASPRCRLLVASLCTALATLLALALIMAPGFLLACARNGFGDLSYPVVHIAFTTLETSTVGIVLLKTAALYVLIALCLSLLAHLSAALLDSVAPALLLYVTGVLATYMPGFYGGAMAIDDITACLPWAYLWVGYAVGMYGGAATHSITCDVPGMDFASGAFVLGATVAGLTIALLLAAPLATRSLSLPAGLRLRRGERLGRAEGGGTGLRMRPGLVYTAALFRMVLSGPWVYAIALVMAGAVLVPALFSIRQDMSEYTVRHYQQGVYARLGEAVTGGIFEEGSQEAEDARRAHGLLSDFVTASGSAAQFRALAAYERFCAELSQRGSPVLGLASGTAGEAFDAERAEAKAVLLERVAALPDPSLYALSELMPGSFYLSFLYGTLPFAVWLVPSVTAALAVAALRCRGGFLQQVPVSHRMELLSGCAVAFVIAVLMLVVVAIPGTAAATARNGLGSLDYPVVYVQSGAVVASTVGAALLEGAGVQALVSGLAVSMLLAVEALTRSFRSVCVAAVLGAGLAMLAVNASVLAAGEGFVAMALGWLPLTYFDVARTVGAAGYDFASGAGISTFAACLALGVSIPLVLAVCGFAQSVRLGRAQAWHRSTTVQRI